VTIERREFLSLLGAAVAGAGVAGCGPDWMVPSRMLEVAQRGPGIESWRASVCGLCEGGCGLSIRTVDGIPVGVKGNPRHPLNRGGICPVGQAALEVLYSPARLRDPLRRGEDGNFYAVSWDAALDELTARLGDLHAAARGGGIALLSGEPSRLFHELAGLFLHALGSPHLGRSSAIPTVPYFLSQGLSEPPAVDLAGADLVLSFGLDVFEDGPAPVHAMAAMIGSREGGERATLLHVGTRLSPSAAKADERVTVRPGTHGAFALGVAHVLVREGSYDRRFVAEHTAGFEDWTDDRGRSRLGFRRLLLERYYPDRVARICGCGPDRIISIARRFGRASAPVAVSGGDAVASSNATATVVAIHALNALVGAFDRPGGVVLAPRTPFKKLAPPPRPVAGTSLFAYPGEASGFGVDPVAALIERASDETDPLELLLVVGADPVHASPLGDRLREAMARIPVTVALTPLLDETAAAADLVLPTPCFLETWTDATTPATVGISVLGLGAPVLEPLFDSRHPGDLLLDLAARLGAPVSDALPWASYSDYLKDRIEGLWVSGQGSAISGSFEESWVQFLEQRGWRFLEHNELEEFWDDLVREGGWWNPVRERGDWSRLFPNASGRYHFFSPALEQRLIQIGGAEGEPDLGDALDRGCVRLGLGVSGEEACLPHFEPPRETGDGELLLVPFRPSTARGRLGATSPMVLEMFGYPVLTGWETWLELVPETADELDLGDGDRVSVETARGAVEAIVRVRPGSSAGVAHVALGLGRRAPTSPTETIGSNPLALIEPAVDPLGGMLSTGSSRVRLRLLRRRPHGGPAPYVEGKEP